MFISDFDKMYKSENRSLWSRGKKRPFVKINLANSFFFFVLLKRVYLLLLVWWSKLSCEICCQIEQMLKRQKNGTHETRILYGFIIKCLEFIIHYRLTNGQALILLNQLDENGMGCSFFPFVSRLVYVCVWTHRLYRL